MPAIIFSEKGAWSWSRDSEIFRVPPNISGTGKARTVKFGRPIHRDSLNKSP